MHGNVVKYGRKITVQLEKNMYKKSHHPPGKDNYQGII